MASIEDNIYEERDEGELIEKINYEQAIKDYEKEVIKMEEALLMEETRKYLLLGTELRSASIIFKKTHSEEGVTFAKEPEWHFGCIQYEEVHGDSLANVEFVNKATGEALRIKKELSKK